MNHTQNTKSAGLYISNQLSAAGVTLGDLDESGMFIAAGGGMSVKWLENLIGGKVKKLTARHLIGLRRLFADPVDTIIGLEYMQPEDRSRNAGLKRIAAVIGGKYNKRTHYNLCIDGDCSPIIIDRIRKFSAWAILNNAADIKTSPDEIRQQLRDTFSLARLRIALNANIDDILGLGTYDPESEFLATVEDTPEPDPVPEKVEWTEEDEKRKKESDVHARWAHAAVRAPGRPRGYITFFQDNC